MQWSAVGCSLPSWSSKIPFSELPLHCLIEGNITETPLQEVLVWSLQVLGSGIHPSCDHKGVPWPER
eukprot:9784563-Alexandrium_andersonii.AAC.1